MVGLEYILNLYNIQQIEIAQKIGIKKQNITLWIKGKQKIPKKHLILFSVMFELPAEYFEKKLNETEKLEIQKYKLLKDSKIASELVANSTSDLRRYDEKFMESLELGVDKVKIAEAVSKSVAEEIKREIFFNIKLLALGIVKREALCIEGVWNGERNFEEKKALASMFLIYNKLQKQGSFNTNTYSLSKFITTPLINSDYPYLSELFKDYPLEETVLYDKGTGSTTEFCHYIKLDTEYIEHDSQQFVNKIFQEASEKEYSQIREFVIRERLIASSEFAKKIYFENRLPEKFLTLVESIYEDVRDSYYEGDHFKICPYCKHPLKIISAVYKCSDARCNGRCGHWGNFEELHGRYKVVNSSLWRYIVYPGLMEIRLYDQIKVLPGVKEVVLYPHLDFADLKITTTNGEIIMVDVKDWKSAFELYKNLSIKQPFSKSARHSNVDIKYDKAVLVVPEYKKKSYLQILRQWNRKDLELYTDKGFIIKLKKRLGEENERDF